MHNFVHMSDSCESSDQFSNDIFKQPTGKKPKCIQFTLIENREK